MNTIKRITLSLILLSVVFISNAQKLNYGIQAGTNFAVQSPIADYFNNEDVKVGLHAGIFAQYNLNQKWSLKGEINYDQLGSQSSSVTNKFDYLNIPILLNYSIGKSDLTALTFDAYAGPYAGYLLNAKSEISTAETESTEDLKDDTNKYTGGVILGLGLRYPVKENKIMLDLRLGLGLAPFDKNDYEPKNKYIGLSLGYQF
jgi:outer membrane scaffolding protein for murein synthesis (MipA/OmpV family)